MNKKAPQKALEKRMSDAYAELRKVANEKVTKNTTQAYTLVGLQLGITGQTVFNYVWAKGKSANGFMIEAITEEFKKLKL